METAIIAVTGKGGVGKTSIAALLVRTLAAAHPGARILAIDADPAVGLATTLGVTVEKTVDDIRKAFVNSVEGGASREAIEQLSEARYEITGALVEKEAFAFLAIGRPEGAGCYCKVNAYLKDIISLLALDFDYVVIDGEAGIEQVNRRVLEKITHLLLVSDTSKKGTAVIQNILSVADEMTHYQWAGAIINRVRSKDILRYLDTGGIEIAATIGEDEQVGLFDLEGQSLWDLPEGSPAALGVCEALEAMDLA